MERVLQVLRVHPAGLFGNEIAKAVGGVLVRARIYGVLANLVDAGLVREQQEGDRTRHFITDAGRAALVNAAGAQQRSAYNCTCIECEISRGAQR